MRAGEVDVTALLAAWSKGEESARTRLVDAVYGELRKLARGFLQREAPGHSLPPTALVHELYLKLVRQGRAQWRNRHQFFALASHLMRRILVDHARRRLARKRGGAARVPLQPAGPHLPPSPVALVALDAALERLAQHYPRQSQLVELRFFGGLSVAETAAVLGVSPITVKRDWAVAKAWLYREIHGRTG